jgi:hypothetical protein
MPFMLESKLLPHLQQKKARLDTLPPLPETAIQRLNQQIAYPRNGCIALPYLL